jgi:hypothetical protein
VRAGDVVGGRYELEELLGAGSMASVYRAHDRVLERTVALKVLEDRYGSDPEHVERFRREARAIARLTHPNIVTVIDRGEVDGCQFIVFEHVRGANLKELLRRRRRFPVAEALAVVHQAARGLAFAHEHGVVHRDVKPQNVLVDEDGVAKVTDFGIARSASLDDDLTLAGTVLGTGDYISPEQATGRRAEERSDQYSLGALLYELLTGEVPYPAESTVAAAMRHVHDPIPSVREKRSDASTRVDAVVRRALAKDPEGRYPSMDAFIAALEACLAEEAREDDGQATQVIRPSSPPRRRRRKAPWPLLAGLLVIGAGAFAVWALATERFTPGEEPSGGTAAPVRLTAAADYDPLGDGEEHRELLEAASDGDPQTWWRTETYSDFSETKDGVGIVFDAGRRRELSELVVLTDTPGFQAQVQGGNSPGGEFVELSDEAAVAERTVFELTGGSYRYYLVWITDLDEVAHVNEVRARS